MEINGNHDHHKVHRMVATGPGGRDKDWPVTSAPRQKIMQLVEPT